MAADFEPQIVYNQSTIDVNDLLYAAYRKAGALKHAGQGISPSESQEGLRILNSMVDGWKQESLMIEYFRRTLQPVAINQQSYSVGPGQDWNIERPQKIPKAGFIVDSDPNPAEIPMEIVLSYTRWASIIVKSVGSTYPLALYYVPAAPFGQALTWPVPTQDGFVAIYTPQYLSEFSTTDDILYAPNGYREMIEYNLAVAIHEVYPDKPMVASVASNATRYKARIKAAQRIPMYIGSDPAAMQENHGGRTWYGGNPRAWTPYD